MSTRDQIMNAITHHAHWKGHLITAIQTGNSQFDPNIVKMDNQCEFGKWLYENVGKFYGSPHYQAVKQLHANFHKEAGRILDLALKGKADEALSALGFNSHYSKTSSALTTEMTKWAFNLPPDE